MSSQKPYASSPDTFVEECYYSPNADLFAVEGYNSPMTNLFVNDEAIAAQQVETSYESISGIKPIAEQATDNFEEATDETDRAAGLEKLQKSLGALHKQRERAFTEMIYLLSQQRGGRASGGRRGRGGRTGRGGRAGETDEENVLRDDGRGRGGFDQGRGREDIGSLAQGGDEVFETEGDKVLEDEGDRAVVDAVDISQSIGSRADDTITNG